MLSISRFTGTNCSHVDGLVWSTRQYVQYLELNQQPVKTTHRQNTATFGETIFIFFGMNLKQVSELQVVGDVGIGCAEFRGWSIERRRQWDASAEIAITAADASIFVLNAGLLA